MKPRISTRLGAASVLAHHAAAAAAHPRVAILFRAIDALKTFDIIFVMTQGGPPTPPRRSISLLFNQAFSYFNMGYASSMAVALFALVLGASLLLIKVRRSTTW